MGGRDRRSQEARGPRCLADTVLNNKDNKHQTRGEVRAGNRGHQQLSTLWHAPTRQCMRTQARQKRGEKRKKRRIIRHVQTSCEWGSLITKHGKASRSLVFGNGDRLSDFQNADSPAPPFIAGHRVQAAENFRFSSRFGYNVTISLFSLH